MTPLRPRKRPKLTHPIATRELRVLDENGTPVQTPTQPMNKDRPPVEPPINVFNKRLAEISIDEVHTLKFPIDIKHSTPGTTVRYEDAEELLNALINIRKIPTPAPSSGRKRGPILKIRPHTAEKMIEAVRRVEQRQEEEDTTYKPPPSSSPSKMPTRKNSRRRSFSATSASTPHTTRSDDVKGPELDFVFKIHPLTLDETKLNTNRDLPVTLPVMLLVQFVEKQLQNYVTAIAQDRRGVTTIWKQTPQMLHLGLLTAYQTFADTLSDHSRKMTLKGVRIDNLLSAMNNLTLTTESSASPVHFIEAVYDHMEKRLRDTVEDFVVYIQKCQGEGGRPLCDIFRGAVSKFLMDFDAVLVVAKKFMQVRPDIVGRLVVFNDHSDVMSEDSCLC